MKVLERYIEGLRIGQGRRAGEKFILLPWQRRFVRRAFAQEGDAVLSLGRGGGKTTLFAGIGAATVDFDGPLVAPMAGNIIVASSFAQATIAFRHVLRFLSPTLAFRPKRYRVQDSVNTASITDRKTGSSLKVIGSDPARMHGLAPRLILMDEVAQWPGGTIDAMISALRTSRGKIEGSKALWIGTRPESPGHVFERALQGRGVSYAQVHAASQNDPPFRRATWLKENPSLGHLPDLEKIIREEANDARIDQAALQSFRSLRLNMGVPAILQSLLLDSETCRRVEAEDESPFAGKYVLGVDLGQSMAMSACAGYWPESGRLEALACFPALPDLRERGLADGVGRLYLEMASRGELIVAGRRVSDIPTLLAEALERWGRPSMIICDRWREAELRQTLDTLYFPQAELVVRGMGWKDGAADIREFRAAVLRDQVRPSKSLLLRAAMSEARTVSDSAGNAKLSKRTEGGRRASARDDAAAATILAVAEGQRRMGRTQRARPRRVMIAG